MITAHLDAVRSLISSVPNVRLYRPADVPNSPSYPYIVLRAGRGVPTIIDMSDTSTFSTFRFRLTYVAIDERQVEALTERIDAALLDVTPVVTGRTTGQLAKPISRPVEDDTDVDPVVLYAVDEWEFSSVPA